MAKPVTMSSLTRVAARSEPDFVETVTAVQEEMDMARTADFFDRLNIPRSTGGENLTDPLPELQVRPDMIGNFAEEYAISTGLQRFLDRHERKLKWHAGHPSLEGGQNVFLLMRAMMMGTEVRLTRLLHLLNAHTELSADDWAKARSMMNSSYLSIRNSLKLLSSDWIDAVVTVVESEDLAELGGGFYQLVDGHLRRVGELREKIEARRLELTVLPEGYPPVKPPYYFSGDLLGRGPWRQYWQGVEGHAHRFREAIG